MVNIEKVLKNYPFRGLIPRIALIDNLKVYEETIGDKPGRLHDGINYTFKSKGKYCSFGVFACHGGLACQGENPTWGRFVSIESKTKSGVIFRTIYGHLDIINQKIPLQSIKDYPSPVGIEIPANSPLGTAGISGVPSGIIQLHFEFIVKHTHWIKVDPYGINSTVSSGLYPQPGDTLDGLNHYWLTNNPPFAH